MYNKYFGSGDPFLAGRPLFCSLPLTFLPLLPLPPCLSASLLSLDGDGGSRSPKCHLKETLLFCQAVARGPNPIVVQVKTMSSLEGTCQKNNVPDSAFPQHRHFAPSASTRSDTENGQSQFKMPHSHDVIPHNCILIRLLQ